MKILIIGGGGREHALAHSVACSTEVSDVFVAPGNAGTASLAKTQNINLTDIDDLIIFARSHDITYTLIGPEAPLATGIVDAFLSTGLLALGPTQLAAQLESSKAFCKARMCKYGVPTAAYAEFSDSTAALAYLETSPIPCVIKADGLAAGKGVIIAEDEHAARDAIVSMLDENRFGSAGRKIIIEEFLTGIELSFIVLTDGKTIIPFASAQDYKRLQDGDLGPNTGGMGAYSPSIKMHSALENKIMQTVIEPMINGLRRDAIPYTGFLFAGIMVGPNDTIKVLEFNCRFGDPEAQVVLPRLQSDFAKLCYSALNGTLAEQKLTWDKRSCLGVVCAAGGYPDKVQAGAPISPLPSTHKDIHIFHAATQQSPQGLVTSGGRVLCISAFGNTIQQAKKNAYNLIKNIHWPNMHYRKDIAHQAINP